MPVVKKRKKRLSVSLTPAYVDRLDRLVKEGIYFEYQTAIRDALRRLFEHHGVPLTIKEGED